MSVRKAKSGTALAVRYQREAHVERIAKPVPILVDMWERNASELVTLPHAPDVGAGGEIVHESPLPDSHVAQVRENSKRWAIRDTLAEGATRIAEDASIQRADLLMQPSFDAVAMGLDAAESIHAENSLEKMLAHQMAIAHEMAMRFADKALSYEHSKAGDQVEATRCANTAARLMGTFQDAMLTLQRIRSGGTQTVTVQHVTVAQGGQAVIGNVGTGGQPRRGRQRNNG